MNRRSFFRSLAAVTIFLAGIGAGTLISLGASSQPGPGGRPDSGRAGNSADSPTPPPEPCREEEREDSGCESRRAIFQICPAPTPPRRLRCL